MPTSSATPAPSTSPLVARLLVVDDTPLIHEDFRKILLPAESTAVANESALFAPAANRAPRDRFEIDSAYQGAEALARVQRAAYELRPYAVAFVDMRMPPGWDGIETVRQLWAVDPDIQIVICTAHSDYSWEETVQNLGESDNWVILKKPFDNIEVLQLAHALAKKWTMTRLNRERLADLGQTVRRRTIALRYSENRFVQAFHANPIAVALQAQDGRYLDANESFCRLIDVPRESVVGAMPLEFGGGPGAELWQEMLGSIERRAPLRGHRARVLTGKGGVREVVVSVDRMHVDSQTCVLSSFEDITERLQLEEQLRQAQKMEAIGQLASGVAHDFNNLLTVIQSFASLALDDARLPEEHRAGLGQIRLAVDRASTLTRQLLVFSRRQITNPKPVDLGASVTGLRKMLARLVPAHVKLHCACDANLPAIQADEPNLVHAVVNLVVNAVDALPPHGGEIWVTVRALHLAEATGRHPDARAGDFACLSVRDNGSGIAPEVLPHIFEPFFTTKAPGNGTGLGLSTVYGIVRQHEGWIEVTSSADRGTTFDLYLPVIATPAPAAAGPVPAAPAPTPRGRGERVLLVEDDESVRRSTRMLATRCGFVVTEACDAPSALLLAATSPQPFDLLLTDMVMPNGMNGAELAAALRRTQPGLKVVLSTGYSQALLDESARALANAQLLLKPYTVDTLVRTLREALDAPAPAAEPTTAD